MSRDRLSPAERSLRGRMGAYVVHARYDPRHTTAPARAAFLRRFIDEVDPGRVLRESERLRRAAAARKAYFTRLAYLASRRRRQRARRKKTEMEMGVHRPARGTRRIRSSDVP
jgi:hypothetical protein